MFTFAKYHGLGNDFVIIDLRLPENITSITGIEKSHLAKVICHRRHGIGSDGVLLLSSSSYSNCIAKMRIINADGSESEMCGNGLRCVAKYIFEQEKDTLETIWIETGAGNLKCEAIWTNQQVHSVCIEMGKPKLRRETIPMAGKKNDTCLKQAYTIQGRTFECTALSMGNPHAVFFVKESGKDLVNLANTLGPIMETHPDFPAGCNVEFARIKNPTEIELVVWERGVGITQACGTGACATAVASCLNHHSMTESTIKVHLLGGTLSILVFKNLSQVRMTGAAAHVFNGNIDLPTYC